MAGEEESIVEKVIENLRSYLQNNLSIDEEFIEGLQGQTGDLLHKSDADRIHSLLSAKGGTQALGSLLDHMAAYYVDETLESFCSFLDDYSKCKKRPRLRQIATRIRAEMKTYRQTDTQQQNGDLVPTVRATQGENTSNTSTTEKRSHDKIKEIVEMYRSGDYDVHVPEIPELERDFRDLMVKLDLMLASADPQMMRTIRSNVRMEYRTYIYGWKPVELPAVPETPSGLYDFIAAKSTPYEVPLVNCAVQVLKVGTLTKTFQAYKTKLADRLRGKLHSCKMRNVQLPKREDCTHLAAVVSRDKDLVLISLVLHIKEYLMKYLQLEETMFEGFGEGCTVLFFSILSIDAVLLAPKILSHSAELKRMFDITHLLVFDYFACDLERATIEIPATSQRTEKVKIIKDLEEDMLHQFEQLQTYEENIQVLQGENQICQKNVKEKDGHIKQLQRDLRKKEREIQRLQYQCKALQVQRSLQLSGVGTTDCEDKLFVLAYKDGVKDKYMCHVYEKSKIHWGVFLPRYTTAQLHMVITYSTSHWSQIVRKYCKPHGKDWELRTVIQDFTVEGDEITANIPEHSGPTWSCFIDGIDQVPTSSLDFTKTFPPENDGPKLLEQAVKSSVYPPKINLMASSDVHVLIEYNRSRLIYLDLAGSSPGIRIPVRIIDRVKP